MMTPVLWRAVGDPNCKHDWYLAGATTASDGWACKHCPARVETWPDAGPPKEPEDD